MTLSDFVNLFIRVIFLLLTLLALRDLWRHRDRTRIRIAAMFVALVIMVLAGSIPVSSPLAVRVIMTAIALALVSPPYLLLSLINSFRPIPKAVQWAAGGGLAIAWLVILAGPYPIPEIIVLLLVAYFVVFESYAAIALFRGARATHDVSRWRLSLIAIGSAMLAGAIILLLLRGYFPALGELGDIVFALMAMIATLSYYLGFAPPRWLRRSWQMSELHSFLRQSAGRSMNQEEQEVLTNVCEAALRSTGAIAAVALLGEKSDKTLSLAAAVFSDDKNGAGGLALLKDAAGGLAPLKDAAGPFTLLEAGAATLAWYLQQPQIARDPAHFGIDGANPSVAQLMAQAEALFAVPIATAIQTPAMLLIFLRTIPLFADDDLSMLALYAEQSAITLDNIVLLAEQRDLVARLVENETRLEELVQERTAELSETNRRLLEEATERRRVTEELRELNEELEQRVHRRTRLLEEANKELETFAYSVSHDLRAPLRAIDGFSKALLEDYNAEIDAQGQRYLERVRANAQRMGELIEALLKLSRTGRAEMQAEQVDLSGMAHSIAAELQRRDAERSVALTIEPDLSALADRRLLHIVLWNLFENAWKFTGKRDSAEIEFGSVENDGERAYFVRDNGAGFDMAYADKLFGAFQRLHAMDEFAGTGVGLATVQRIIHRHHGRVWAQAAPEQGATFYFTLSLNGQEEDN